MKGVQLVFYRTLLSQSAASVTMGSIAACLREAGYPARLVLLEKQNPDNPRQLFSECATYPIVIAKPNFKDHQELFPMLESGKRNGHFEKIFFCGPYSSLNAQSIMELNPWLEGVILGEPEETVLEIMQNLDSYSTLAGGVWRAQDAIVSTGPRTLTRSLNNLPFPARDIELKEPVRYVNIEATRGCQFNCSFCHVPLYHGQSAGERRMVRDSHLVAQEMESLYKMGKTLFIFNDPMFWSGPRDDDRLLALCEEIKSRKLDVRLYVYLRCNPFPSEKILGALKEAGLVRVFLGIENAAQNSLAVYNKVISITHSRKAWGILQDLGINVHIGYIVFEPYATLEDIRKNVEFLHEIGKLFRIGVIVEPPRAIPQSQLLVSLTRDGLQKELGDFRTLTYGYEFKHQDTFALFTAVRKIFFDLLADIWYNLEYYCTSFLLLNVLAQRAAPHAQQELNNAASGMRAISSEINDTLRAMLIACIDAAAQAKTPEEIVRTARSDVQRIAQLYGELQARWGVFADACRTHCGDRPLEETFKGIEGL